MQAKLFVVFLLFWVCAAANAQSKILNGRIYIEDATPKGIHIINIATEIETVSDSDGLFSLSAFPGDVLIFTAGHIDFHRVIVDDKDFESEFKVTLVSKIDELQEVTVINHNFNAVGLGILTKPAVRYTTAERRLYSATSGPLTSLINFISGRTKDLKQDLATERKNMMLEALEDLYPDSFYREHLHIEPSLIRGFHYFLVERSDFREALNSGNESLLTLIIIDSALNFNTLRQSEKD
jgi:hypothetical protein